MKIIDLLNMISKGEEVPKKYRYKNKEYGEDYCYMLYEATGDCNELGFKSLLNDEVEILEEEKKIPEKLKLLNNVGNSSDIGEFKDKQQLNNHLLKDKLNEVIHYLQYLKSKGE